MTRGVRLDPRSVAAAAAEMDFRTLSDFGAGQLGVFRSAAGGPSPWEMHPECDELLQVLEGEIELEILPPTGAAERRVVGAGELIVVPQGRWHRQTLRVATVELYLTPGPTEHSTAEDPRAP